MTVTLTSECPRPLSAVPGIVAMAFAFLGLVPIAITSVGLCRGSVFNGMPVPLAFASWFVGAGLVAAGLAVATIALGSNRCRHRWAAVAMPVCGLSLPVYILVVATGFATLELSHGIF